MLEVFVIGVAYLVSNGMKIQIWHFLFFPSWFSKTSVLRTLASRIWDHHRVAGGSVNLMELDPKFCMNVLLLKGWFLVPLPPPKFKNCCSVLSGKHVQQTRHWRWEMLLKQHCLKDLMANKSSTRALNFPEITHEPNNMNGFSRTCLGFPQTQTIWKKKVGVSDEPHRGPVWQITG